MAREIARVYKTRMAEGPRRRRPPPLPRDELEATVEARRELGREREADLLDSFLDRVERDIDARVDARLAERARPARRSRTGADWSAVVLGILSIGSGVGATGAATGTGNAWIALVAWVAIAIVNVSYNRRG
jgi:Flp pilus assembly protein TadB